MRKNLLSGVADEPDYASCEATIGRLDMDVAQLKDNLVSSHDRH